MSVFATAITKMGSGIYDIAGRNEILVGMFSSSSEDNEAFLE